MYDLELVLVKCTIIYLRAKVGDPRQKDERRIVTYGNIRYFSGAVDSVCSTNVSRLVM